MFFSSVTDVLGRSEHGDGSVVGDSVASKHEIMSVSPPLRGAALRWEGKWWYLQGVSDWRTHSGERGGDYVCVGHVGARASHLIRLLTVSSAAALSTLRDSARLSHAVATLKNSAAPLCLAEHWSLPSGSRRSHQKFLFFQFKLPSIVNKGNWFPTVWATFISEAWIHYSVRLDSGK